MKDITKAIILVPADVQYEILYKYILATNEVYEHAFFQWRIKFPSKINHDFEMLKSNIESRSKGNILREPLPDP